MTKNKTSTSTTSTSTTPKTTDTEPTTPKPDPLAPYLQYTQEGDPNADTPAKQWLVASLTQGGHTTSLYARSKVEIEERAREILAAHSIEV